MEAAFIWDEDRIAVLTKMVAENYTARTIAERLGASRNAILGKMYRLGITQPERPKAIRITKKPATPVVRLTRFVRVTHNAHSVKLVESLGLGELRCVEIVPRHVSFSDLGRKDCRYPYGDTEITFCGHPVQEGSSYCQAHHALCWEKPRVRANRVTEAAA